VSEKKSIAVDLDGTILDFDWDSWASKQINYFGQPKRGAIKALTALQKLGFKIIIHTCRTNIRVNPQYTLGELWMRVEKILECHKIPYDEVWVETGKPLADYYIDDRAIEFDNWERIIGLFNLRRKK